MKGGREDALRGKGRRGEKGCDGVLDRGQMEFLFWGENFIGVGTHGFL